MPSELEEILTGYPNVQDICVTPADDAELGQRICECILPKNGADREQFALQNVRRYLAERNLASFKLPDQVMLVNEMPLTKVGKIYRQKLRKLAEKTGK